MSKRKLTISEIEEILDFIKPQIGIPLETSMTSINQNKKLIRKQLQNELIYPKLIPSLKTMIYKQYVSSQIQPGESVGIISAQSIGEKQTQTTLDSFHKAGSAGKTTTVGVPRAEEILGTTKDPKSVNCFIYFLSNNKTIPEVREFIKYSLVELTFKKITKESKIILDKKDEDWYESFELLYGDDFRQYENCISLKINTDYLFEYKINLETISKAIDDVYSDMTCVFSPDVFGQIDIFVDTTSICLPENRLAYIDSENAVEIYLEEVVLQTVEKIVISGISGVKNIYFIKEEKTSTWMIETDGGNFNKLLDIL